MEDEKDRILAFTALYDPPDITYGEMKELLELALKQQVGRDQSDALLKRFEKWFARWCQQHEDLMPLNDFENKRDAIDALASQLLFGKKGGADEAGE